MTQKPQHTPGPWHQQGVEIHDAKGKVIIGASYGVNRKNDTPFIVRACNSHDALVSIVERIKAFRDYEGPDMYSPDFPDDEEIEAALALAKGE